MTSQRTSVGVVIPSHNRGETLLPRVRRLREELPQDARIFVYKDGLTDDQPYYDEIGAIPGITLTGDGERRGHGLAFLTALELCTTQVAVIISDEDLISSETVERLSTMDWSGLAVFRGSIEAEPGTARKNAGVMKASRRTRGADAASHYIGRNNHCWGTAYNLGIARPLIEEAKSWVWKCPSYPGLVLDMLCMTAGDYARSDMVTLIEGDRHGNAEPITVFGGAYCSLGSRIDQHMALTFELLAIRDAGRLSHEGARLGYAALWRRLVKMGRSRTIRHTGLSYETIAAVVQAVGSEYARLFA